jgi:hypothetical protein
MKGNLIHIFLQATDPSGSLVSKLGDQLFSVVLLVAVTYILWNKITKLQDKLDNYLETDRKLMMDVINRSTEVISKNTEVIEKVLNQK